MTLAELRYLVAVADLRHFGRAAERCRITQPTLSSQLRKLEETLGVPLVERTTRSVTLTPIGESVVAHARRILEEADQISELVRHRHGTLTSVLRLGIIPTLSPYILPLLLDRLHQRFPDLRLVLREDLTDNLIDALEAYHARRPADRSARAGRRPSRHAAVPASRSASPVRPGTSSATARS